MSHDPASPGEPAPLPGPPPLPPLPAEVSPVPVSVPPRIQAPAPRGPFIGSSLALTAIYVGGLVGIQTAAAVFLMMIKAPPSFGPWATTAMMAVAFAFPVALIPWISKCSLGDVLSMRLTPAAALPGIVLLTLGGSVIAGEIATLTEVVLPMPAFMARMFDEVFSTFDPVGSFLMLVVAPPLIEETLCRGLVLRAMLRRWKPATAVVASAAVFGLIHLNPWQFFYATWLGLVLGWAYTRTRSLGLCVMMHAINNGMAWLMMRLDPDWAGMSRKSYLEPPEHLPPLLLLAGFGLLIAGAALLLRLPAATGESGPPTLDPGSPSIAPA